jgi:hypothetical protein
MKKLLVCSALALLMMTFGVGINTAAAEPPLDLLGVWSGTAKIVTDTPPPPEPGTMTLEITTQTGVRFSGTMQFGEETPFPVNGVVDKKSIRITGSASIFEGSIFGVQAKKIRGTGSRLQTTDFPSASILFTLTKE